MASVPADQGASPAKRGRKAAAKSDDPSVVECYGDLDDHGKVAFWTAQIDQADKDDKKYVDTGQATIRVYREGVSRDSNSSISKFNILNSNVGVLAPAIYSATPKPDVRRRFPSSDPVARYAADVLERALEYTHDQFDVDHEAKAACLDMLLPGRGVCRVMYEAQTSTVSPGRKFVRKNGGLVDPDSGDAAEKDEAGSWASAGAALDGEPEAVGGGDFEEDQDVSEWYFGGTPYPKVEDERTWFEHVQWKDYRQGAGRTWREVEWIAFRHALTRDQIRALPIPKALADRVTLDYDTRNELPPAGKTSEPSEREQTLPFKRGLIWEIWYRTDKKVIFMAPSVRDKLLLEKDPEIKFTDFYPAPRPLMAIDNPDDLKPTAEYTIYKGLAEELNRAVRRLQKLVSALKVRGVYAGAVVDFERVFKGDDNELIPATDAQALLVSGGASSMDALVWMVPVDKLIIVVRELYAYVEQLKQQIYEITGISDIARGATKATETLGAQQLKAQFASVRILPRQQEMQRFMRDLIRLESDVICKIFGPDTLGEMTGVMLPTAEQKQQFQAMAQAAAQAQQQAQQTGQPAPQIPPPPPSPDPDVSIDEYMKRPSWEDVMGVLRGNMERSYKIDIETDSTIASDIAQQQGAITELVQAIVTFFQGVTPFVATPNNPAGILPPEAAKTILMAAVRRFRMGKEVEEALDMIGQPGQASQEQQAPPGPSPEQQAAEQQQQLEMQKLQAQTSKDQGEQQVKMAQLEIDKAKIMSDREFRSAELALQSRSLDIQEAKVAADIQQANSDQAIKKLEQAIGDALHGVHQKIGALGGQVSEIANDANAPVEIVKGPDGRPTGVKKGKRMVSLTGSPAA